MSTKSVFFSVSCFLYLFLNYFRTLLGGTHLKYLFTIGFCDKMHGPVEFRASLPFLILHQEWWKLMMISDAWIQKTCHVDRYKTSWEWNYQGQQETVLLFCIIHNFFQRCVQHGCLHPALLRAAGSSGWSQSSSLSSWFCIIPENGNSWFGDFFWS